MSNITLTIPNDDHIALRAFSKALEEMALAHGAPLQLKINQEALSKALDKLQQAAPRMMEEARFDGEELQEPEIDTTAQEVESLAPTESVAEKLNRLFIDDGDINPTTDKTGTPWDERIHSASKALNSDGTWRLRRKPKDMDEAEWLQLVADVKLELSGEEQYDQEELTQQMNELSQRYDGVDIDPAHEKGDETAEPPVTVTPVMTDEEVKAFDDVEPPVTPPGDDFHTDASVVTEQTVAGIPPIPVPPPVVVPPAPEEWTFPKLMTFLTERQGKIDVPTVNMLLAQDGIASLPELNAHPDKIGPFVARVKAHLGE